MKKMMTALAAFTLTAGLAACSSADEPEAAAAVGDISGNWMINLDSAQFENDNRDFVLTDGEWTCNSCTPPYSVTADGEWQTIDRPGADGQMIEVVDDRTVKMASRLGDKELGNGTWTVSEDGNTLTQEWTDLSGDQPVSGKGSFTRTEAGPEGSHAVSGKWTSNGIESYDEAGLRFGYSLKGEQLTLTDNGGGWSATLGGDPVPVEGSDSNVMVAVERIGENGFRETYSRDGETLSVSEITIDGDTLTGVSTDARDDSVVRWTASRQ